MTLIFLAHPFAKKRSWLEGIVDLVCVGSSVLIGLYAFWVSEDLPFRAGIPETSDLIIGILAIIVVLEATRRVIGWALPVIALASLF